MPHRTSRAIKRATENMKNSIERLQGYNLAALQENVLHNRLASDQQTALLQFLTSIKQLVEAQSLFESNGKQRDMFAQVNDRDFAAWTHKINQRPLF